MTSLVNVTNDYIAGAHRFYTIGTGTSNDNLTNFSIQPKYETVRIQDSNVFVTGSIYPTSCNVYDIGSSNYRWRDLYLSGNTIDLGGTRISRNNDTGGMKISSKVNDTPLDFTAQHITALGTLYASNITIAGNALMIEDNGNVGMGTAIPTQKLDVRGNIYASGNIVCSNISVIGDFVRLDTITSNTEQMVVENAGTGPALKVTQSGANSVAEFYDSESGVALFVGNGGNIGIGTNAPLAKLDLVGNLNLTGNIYKNGDLFAGGDTMPIGIIVPFYGTTVSDVSWLICDGSTYTRSNYIELADFLGVNPASSTFQVPDLRDKYLKGKGTGSAVKDVGGSTTKTLIEANLPAHTHTGTTDNSGAHSHTWTATRQLQGIDDANYTSALSKGDAGSSDNPTFTTSTEPNHTHTFTTASTGSGTAFDIQPPYTVVNYIIKAKNNQYTTSIRAGDYWSNSNNEVFYQSGNIGIGTTKPQQLLDVNGNALIRGNIGIGTDNPMAKLHVNGDVTITSTGALTIPRGTTAQRPTNPMAGMIRYNNDEGYIETYEINLSRWIPISSFIGVLATGGTVTEIFSSGIQYRVHTFTSVGTSSFQVLRGGDVEYLIVAGGGGGGRGEGMPGGDGAGGGGAGGLIQGQIMVNAQSYVVSVGIGGTGSTAINQTGGNGGNSIFTSITAIGGGGGGSDANGGIGSTGGSGGSGGGAGAVYLTSTFGGIKTEGQGNNGGDSPSSFRSGGGGGGAGSVGQTSSSSNGGSGGNGISSDISGASLSYSGGGGGGSPGSEGVGGVGGTGVGGTGGNKATSVPSAGQTNTGGGGGGGSGYGTSQDANIYSIGASGGSGIVIIRYRIR